MFDREVALYQRLQERGVQVTFVTYGDSRDLKYTERLPGINILCNRWKKLSHPRYERWLPLPTLLFYGAAISSRQTRLQEARWPCARLASGANRSLLDAAICGQNLQPATKG